MKLPLVALIVCAALAGADGPPRERGDPPRRTMLAGLGDSVPQLFLKLVNDALKGRIAAREIRYEAPSSVVLADAVLYDPANAEVGRVRRASATVSLGSLLAGDIVISRIELDGPQLGLRLHDKKLNLLEALTPKKPPDKKKPNETAFRIDSISAKNGGFTFTDEDNVTVTAGAITAQASLEVDLGHDLVILDVKSPSIGHGKVELKQLDIPMEAVTAQGVRILKDKLELTGVSARALGGSVKANGSIVLRDPGSLSLHGTVDAPKNAWPDRLQKLPFDTPAVHASVDVVGPFTDPHVLADGSFGHAEAYGYAVDSGRGVVDVNKDLVQIKDGTYVKAGGVVGAVGTLKLPSLALELRVKATDVPLAIALTPARLEPAPKGSISGRATISGVVDGDKPIAVDANLTARRAEITSAKLRGDVDCRGSVTVRPKDGRVTVESASFEGDRLSAKGSGDVFTKEERISFKVRAEADDAGALVVGMPPDVKIAHAVFDGTVAGPYKSVKVDGHATATKGDVYGVPVSDVDGHVVAGAVEVVVDRATATAAGGAVTVLKPIVVRVKEKTIAGVASVTNADIARVKSTDGSDYPISGRASGEATLSGPYADPTVSVRAAAGGLTVSDEHLGAVTARAVITKRLLRVTELKTESDLLKGASDNVRLDFDKLVVVGSYRIDAVDLARIESAKAAKLRGSAKGVVVVSGDVYAPNVSARLTAAGVAVGEQRFGDGSLDLTLAPDDAGAPAPKPGAPRAKRRHTVGIATHLVSSLGIWDTQVAYAIERKIVNAHANLVDVDLSPFTTHLGQQVAPLEGFASGTIEASGPLDALDMRLRMRSPEVAVSHQELREGEEQAVPSLVLRPLGPLLVDARMEKGNLEARVCAFTPAAQRALEGPPAPPADEEAHASPCTGGERIWANVVGPMNFVDGSFDLAVEGQVAEASLEDFFPALASRGFAISAKAHTDAQVVKKPQQPVDIRAEATLLEAGVQPQGSLRANLIGTADILYADNRVQLVTPARFASPSHDVDVVVGGSVGTDDIALDVNGSVALAIAKAFTTQIANASGTANTSLAVRGRYDKGVTVEGTFTPSPGAVVTPRSLGEPITFVEGSVRFAPLDADVIRVTASALRARLGDGELTLKGDTDVRTVKKPDQGFVKRWDLTASGSGLGFKLPSGRAEGALDLVLEGTEDAPHLRGRVELTEGLYKKTFELRNFVLQAPPDKASDPLWVTLTPIGLQNLDLDVALSLSNFRVRANVANFDADMHLRGNLHLRNTLRLPRLDGAVEVEEGTVDFPRARFEVVEMQVEFPTTGDGSLNPLVHMTARAELAPGQAGTNDTEIPVDLFLDGDLEKGINLDLSATDPQREWSRSELLGVILFGKTFSETVVAGDASLAVRALMSEAAAPITNELESLVQKNLGADVEIDPGGWRWQIGRRLQLEGPGILVTQSGGTDTTTTTGSTSTAAGATSTTTTEDAVRLRLLIYDHLPFGKNLSLEGRNNAAGSDLRLSLRLFEE